MNLETLAVHVGRAPDPSTGATAPPIVLSTTFEREADGSHPHGYSYTRIDNPNRAQLETALSALEGGTVGAAFSSGLAAAYSLFMALSPGDHIIIPDDLYYGTRHLLKEVMARWDLQITDVDMADIDQVHQAIQSNTRLIYVETPSNPLLQVTNIETVSTLAHNAGAICACDNTFATPILQQPLSLGADLVIHSTSKYLGGHGDVLGGALIAKANNEFFERVKTLQRFAGAVPSPFDCWLVLRGIPTLPYRIRAQSQNAMEVATFLNSHPKVSAVHYPGLDHHDGHELAARQMSLFGAMVSFQVDGGSKEAMAVTAKAKLFTRATSLGSFKSLIEHRASVEGPSTNSPTDLIRLSIGLENAEDLINDLSQAFG